MSFLLAGTQLFKPFTFIRLSGHKHWLCDDLAGGYFRPTLSP